MTAPRPRRAPPRVGCSFSGPAAESWRLLRDANPGASDSEILERVLATSTDPWTVAMNQYAAFRRLAHPALTPDENACVAYFEALLRLTHHRRLDPRALYRALQDAAASTTDPDDA